METISRPGRLSMESLLALGPWCSILRLRLCLLLLLLLPVPRESNPMFRREMRPRLSHPGRLSVVSLLVMGLQWCLDMSMETSLMNTTGMVTPRLRFKKKRYHSLCLLLC